MELEKLMLMIDKLAKQTAASSIKWEEESHNLYTTTIGRHKVFVTEHRQERADPDYVVGFYGANGDVVDAISDVELREVSPRAFSAMRGLYHSAQRSARGVTEIVNDILGELENLDPF